MNLIMKSIDEKVSQNVFLIIEALKLNIMTGHHLKKAWFEANKRRFT